MVKNMLRSVEKFSERGGRLGYFLFFLVGGGEGEFEAPGEGGGSVL